jgi:hypothetical protein
MCFLSAVAKRAGKLLVGLGMKDPISFEPTKPLSALLDLV